MNEFKNRGVSTGGFNPLVSIVVPVYNAEKYLPRCIDSILRQSYKNIELILVDDGSFDRSASICDSYALANDNVKVFHGKNSGVSAARNTGIALASGDYIGFVDADDYVDNDMYSNMVSATDMGLYDVVQCGYRLIADSVQRRECTKPEIIDGGEACILRIFNPDKQISNCIWNKLFKRTVIEGIKFDEHIKIGEDLKFVIEACLCANKVRLIDSVSYTYYFRNDSAMSSGFSLKRLDDFKVNDWCFKTFANNASLQRAIKTRDAKNCVDCYYLSSLDPRFEAERKMIRERLKNDGGRFFLGLSYEISVILIIFAPCLFASLSRIKQRRAGRK